MIAPPSWNGPRPPEPDSDPNANYDNQAVEIMRRVLEPDSTCVDVGCHVGLILDRMLGFAPTGHHYAFEPLPDFVNGLLQKYASRRNIDIYDLALSDEAGDTTFNHVVTNPQFSGIIQREMMRPGESIDVIHVRRARLDDVLPRNARVRFMKVDVEGGELQVFRGARRTLERCRPYIVFEHGLGAADRYGTRPSDVHALLTGCGLQLAVMGEWLASGGRSALTLDKFVDEFESRRNYYFMAYPRA